MQPTTTDDATGLPPWLDAALGIMIAVVTISTALFVLLQLRMNLWGFIGSAQIARREGQVGAVQTFNTNERRGRITLAVVVGVFYGAFILRPPRGCAPTGTRSPPLLRAIYYAIFFNYALTAVVAATTTLASFVRDRFKMRNLNQRKAEIDARLGIHGSPAAAIATAEAGYGGGAGAAGAAAEPPRTYDWDRDVVILVPTYQEPMSNLLSTISAITESDYPPEKIHVLVGFDDDSEKTLTTMYTIERILNGDLVQGYDAAPPTPATANGDAARTNRWSVASESDLGLGVDVGDAAPPAYDTLPKFKSRNKYNGLLKIAHQTRSSTDLRSQYNAGLAATSSPVSMTSLAPPPPRTPSSARSFGSPSTYGGSSNRSSVVGVEPVDEDPRAIEIRYCNINYTIARYEHGGKLHTQAKMFALVEERVNAGVYPRNALLLFVDSDTTLVSSTIRKFVDHFEIHPTSACATGFIVSRNGHQNSFLQQMQDAEYIFMQVSMRYVEATFGSVTCLPGALTMIKYETMHELAKIYFHQPDVDSTFEFCRRKLGEDRFLTHLAMEYLPAYSIGFVPDAVSKTEAPNIFYDLLRQRRRWLLGSLTNEMYMITTPSFLTKYPALIALRITSMLRLGGTCFYYLYVSLLITLVEAPDETNAVDIILLIGVPAMFFVLLAIWSLWQRRAKSLVFFFAFLVTNQILEMLYYCYTAWTMNERTWGGPRADGGAADADDDGEDETLAPAAAPFILFAIEIRAEVMAADPTSSLAAIASVCGTRWRGMSDEQRAPAEYAALEQTNDAVQQENERLKRTLDRDGPRLAYFDRVLALECFAPGTVTTPALAQPTSAADGLSASSGTHATTDANEARPKRYRNTSIHRLMDVVTPASDYDMEGQPRDAHRYGFNGHMLLMDYVFEAVAAGDAAMIAEFANKVTTLRGKPWVMSIECAKEYIRGYRAEGRVALLRAMWSGPVLADPEVRRVLVQRSRECNYPEFRDWAAEVQASL
ncbi:hypothetical protein H9P43_006652 [Blastocladiella emersonii ATCC 22665]|nr:hypothetical protein H9P43_006652 [Blastocladiella emersonii ATCC 22665]